MKQTQQMAPFLLTILLCLYSPPYRFAAAQLFPSDGQDKSNPFGRPGTSPCTDLSVEPQITLTRQGGRFDQTEQMVDFTIIVFVTNQCPDTVQLQEGSFLSYRTNFPPIVQDLSQRQECLGQQRNFSGLVPPHQKAPFLFRIQGCIFLASGLDAPRVTLETGRIVTDKGDRPIPSVAEGLL